MFDYVKRMNVAFGNPEGNPQDFLPMEDISSETETHYNALPWNRLAKQCKSIPDEYRELLNADDSWKRRDAYCDIMVFAFGAFHLMGEDADIHLIHNEQLPAVGCGYNDIEWALDHRSPDILCQSLAYTINFSLLGLIEMGADPEADMKAVLDGVMTRFVKDEDDLIQTKAKHAAKGILLTYTEGEYPTMILKSSVDQPDAPQGKFLKSASYREPIFS